MRRIALAMLGVALVSSPALGDGLPRAALAAPLITPKVTCYVGGFGSGAFYRSNTDISTMVSMDMGDSQLGFGAQVGCDLITSRFLLGIVGDYTFQSGKGANNFLGLMSTTPIGNEGAILGRIGVYTNDLRHTLLYVTGGVVEAEKRSMTLATFSMPFSGGTGAVIGGGIETVLALNFNAFVEYRHETFDTRTGTIASVIPTHVDTVEDKVLAGIRYHLN